MSRNKDGVTPLRNQAIIGQARLLSVMRKDAISFIECRWNKGGRKAVRKSSIAATYFVEAPVRPCT